MLTGIEIFVILKRNWIFFENVDRSPDFWNFERKSNFFRKCWPKWRFSKFLIEIGFFFSKRLTRINFSKFWTEIVFLKMLTKTEISKFWTEIEFFSKMLTEMEIIEILDRNWYFSNMLTEDEIFQIFNRNRNFFENVDRNRFFENVDGNGDYRNFGPKLIFFKYVARRRDFPNF